MSILSRSNSELNLEPMLSSLRSESGESESTCQSKSPTHVSRLEAFVRSLRRDEPEFVSAS
jgi:hypothetical protein